MGALNNQIIATVSQDAASEDINPLDITVHPFLNEINPFNSTSSNHNRHLRPFASYFDNSFQMTDSTQ
jgi:hypothetical protein